MSAEQRARAFDRLCRAGPGGGGAGLGLAIVHRLVTSDGGSVALLPASGGSVDTHVRLHGWIAPALIRVRLHAAAR